MCTLGRRPSLGIGARFSGEPDVTVVRPALTIDGALARIAGHLRGSWAEMAIVVDRAENTVRDWGNPNAGVSVPIEAAIALDLAYMAAGGLSAPIHEAYGLLLETRFAQRFACAIELGRKTMAAIREGGEAHEALVAATLPGATDRDREQALREVEEGINALKDTIPLLARPVAATTSADPARPP